MTNIPAPHDEHGSYAGRLIVHDREMHLDEGDRPFVAGDTLEVIRGNGPREGDHMGVATVTGFDADGSPVLDVRFDERDPARGGMSQPRTTAEKGGDALI